VQRKGGFNMNPASHVPRNLQNRVDGVTMPLQRKRLKWKRNWSCLCGSGKKYKKCCMGDIQKLDREDGNANITELSEDVARQVEYLRAIQETLVEHRNA